MIRVHCSDSCKHVCNCMLKMSLKEHTRIRKSVPLDKGRIVVICLTAECGDAFNFLSALPSSPRERERNRE